MRRLPPTKNETEEAFRHLYRMSEHQTSAFTDAVNVLRRRIDELEEAHGMLVDTPEPEGHGTLAPSGY